MVWKADLIGASAFLIAGTTLSVMARAEDGPTCEALGERFASETGSKSVGYTDDHLSMLFDVPHFGEIRVGCPPYPVVWAFHNHPGVSVDAAEHFARLASVVIRSPVGDIAAALHLACDRALNTPHQRTGTFHEGTFDATCDITPDDASLLLSVADPRRSVP